MLADAACAATRDSRNRTDGLPSSRSSKQNGPRGAVRFDSMVAGARFGNYVPPYPERSGARRPSARNSSARARPTSPIRANDHALAGGRQPAQTQDKRRDPARAGSRITERSYPGALLPARSLQCRWSTRPPCCPARLEDSCRCPSTCQACRAASISPPVQSSELHQARPAADQNRHWTRRDCHQARTSFPSAGTGLRQ